MKVPLGALRAGLMRQRRSLRANLLAILEKMASIEALIRAFIVDLRARRRRRGRGGRGSGRARRGRSRSRLPGRARCGARRGTGCGAGSHDTACGMGLRWRRPAAAREPIGQIGKIRKHRLRARRRRRQAVAANGDAFLIELSVRETLVHAHEVGQRRGGRRRKQDKGRSEGDQNQRTHGFPLRRCAPDGARVHYRSIVGGL